MPGISSLIWAMNKGRGPRAPESSHFGWPSCLGCSHFGQLPSDGELQVFVKSTVLLSKPKYLTLIYTYISTPKARFVPVAHMGKTWNIMYTYIFIYTYIIYMYDNTIHFWSGLPSWDMDDINPYYIILFLGRSQEGEGSAVAYLSRLHDTGDLAGDSPWFTSYIQLDDPPSIH